MFNFTWQQKLDKSQNSLLWEMARESANVYNTGIRVYGLYKDFQKVETEKFHFPKREYLHSQSYQASYQRSCDSIKGYFKSLKSYKKNPSNFTGKPRFPRGDKFIQPIEFKESAINFKNGFLFLSSSRRDNPIKTKWNNDLPKPIYATINMVDEEWILNVVFEKEHELKVPKGDDILSIDLGVKRLATTFDGKKSTIYTGKPILSLNRLHEKKKSSKQKLKSKYKKGSRRHKKITRGINKQIRKIKNKKKDILHKYSREIVNESLRSNCSTIIIGDCSSTHDSPNLGNVNNQKISTNPEQKLRKYIEDKFTRIGGTVKVVPEHYSSQTCPVCGLRHKPKNRMFNCSCGFSFDRDTVGAINIYKQEKVSFDIGRSGGLTPPRGFKIHLRSQLSPSG